MFKQRIRSSMLPGWNDCPRRAASKQFKKLINDAGFELRQTFPTVGAAVGTAVHEAFALACLEKKQSGTVGNVANLVESAFAKFQAEAAGGMEWDDTTPNGDVARVQIQRMTAACIETVLPDIVPDRIETEMIASLGDDFEFSGKIDLFTADGVLIDLKTGALIRPYHAQLGGYALLLKNELQEITSVQTVFIKRNPKTKAQDKAIVSIYNRAVCEKSAWHTIESIKGCVSRFIESSDEWTFPANPMSMMCRPAFCPAHGTEFCRMGN
ncbi:MAG: PD-(D/E)XK nuclease family protein [Magnetococcales bacterium]|nr:PD-(D/E)XK nuclease family protein [Magnetococcales bacterium]